MLPDDYYYYYMESSGYIAFVISEAKLWMNNTLYGCYEVQNDKTVGFAHVLVNFGKFSTHLLQTINFFIDTIAIYYS